MRISAGMVAKAPLAATEKYVEFPPVSGRSVLFPLGSEAYSQRIAIEIGTEKSVNSLVS